MSVCVMALEQTQLQRGVDRFLDQKEVKAAAKAAAQKEAGIGTPKEVRLWCDSSKPNGELIHGWY